MLFLCLFFPLSGFSEALSFNGNVVEYTIRDSNYYPAFKKLSVDVEVPLIENRLPSAEMIAKISDQILSKSPKAYTIFLLFYLPNMPSDHGAYATNHFTPEPEGVKILSFMLMGTEYEELLE